MSEEKDKNLYSNAVGINTSAFEITLDFGYKSPEQASTNEFERIARITMSPTHFKTMLPFFVQAIENYEKTFGKIPVPSLKEKRGKK